MKYMRFGLDTVHQEALQSPKPAQPTHWLQCQYGSGFADETLQLPVAKLVSDHWAPLYQSSADTSALAQLIAYQQNITAWVCHRLYLCPCSIHAHMQHVGVSSLLASRYCTQASFLCLICYCAHVLIVCIFHLFVSVNYIKFILLKWTLVVSPLPYLSHIIKYEAGGVNGWLHSHR